MTPAIPTTGLKLSRWLAKAPLTDLDYYPLTVEERQGLANLATSNGAGYALYSVLRAARSDPLLCGLLVSEEVEAFLNRMLREPAATSRSEPEECRELLEMGILTHSDEEDEARFLADLDAVIPRKPRLAWLEVTNRCAMSCSFCPRQAMTRRVADMQRQHAVIALDQVAGGQSSISLYGYGEPLLHPELPELVAAARQRGLAPVISTVPVRLTPDLSDRLLDAGLAGVVFSIDSLDPATFARARGPAANLVRALANIDAFMQKNDDRGRPARVSVRMLSLSLNREESGSFVDFWTSKGVDVAYIRGFIPVPGEARQDLGGHWISTPLCIWPWTSAVASVDGQLHACCMRAEGPLAMGSWLDRPLEDIWFGGRYRELRESIMADRIPRGHPCRNCPGLFANLRDRLHRCHQGLQSVADLPAMAWEH